VTAIEYALLVALIAMAFVALISQIGDFIVPLFSTVGNQL
jgi:Flp pilus assembly pilin Flp